jgi:formamidopyrimidine-DNA glycosylase
VPELPEVETIARGLRPVLVGRVIIGVSILGPHLVPNLKENFQQKLTGKRILDVHRRGKILIIELDNMHRLAFHLRMTGRLGLMPLGEKPEKPEKHIHLLLALDDQTSLFFQDKRKFGTCGLFAAGELETWLFYASLGPEPLALDKDDFAARLTEKKGQIKGLLLDQRCIAGIGNIYADESLFRAGIHPATTADKLTLEQMYKLHAAVQDVLTEAIAGGGSSIRDYRTAAGLVGSFQETFQVYGRKSLPCPRCDSLIQTTKVAGRTSSFCPHCQPWP